MRATAFEFRIRGFVIGGVIAAGLACGRWDPVRVAAAFPHVPARAVLLAGAALAFVAAMLRTWSTAYLRGDVVHDRVVRVEQVVADGPYRYVRNPLYVAVVLLVMGVAATASRLGAIVMVVGVVIFLLRLIGGEEAALLAARGESYRAFVAAVPRILPSLRPRLPPSGRAPQWEQAIIGESVFWALAVGLTVHAIDGGWTTMGVLAVLGLSARVGQGIWRRRSKIRNPP